MAAPRFVPTSPTATVRAYTRPDAVPPPWSPGRPGELAGRQPSGTRLGYQGPDQGYALLLMDRLAGRLHLATGESMADVREGLLVVALRRASLYGRAPVMHDLEIAARVWGYLDAEAPADLVALRKRLFEGVGNTLHHYAEARAIADRIPEATLRMTPAQASSAFPSRWRDLVGA